VHMEEAMCLIWGRSVWVQRTLTVHWTGAIRTSEKPQNANFVEFYEGEVRRIPIPRTPVNSAEMHPDCTLLPMTRTPAGLMIGGRKGAPLKEVC
jgi:hypothetical protein